MIDEMRALNNIFFSSSLLMEKKIIQCSVGLVMQLQCTGVLCVTNDYTRTQYEIECVNTE